MMAYRGSPNRSASEASPEAKMAAADVSQPALIGRSGMALMADELRAPRQKRM